MGMPGDELDDLTTVTALVAAGGARERRALEDQLHQLEVRVVAAGPVEDMVAYVASRYERSSGCPDLFVVEQCPTPGCANAEVIERSFPGVEVCAVAAGSGEADASRDATLATLARTVQRVRASVATYA